MRWSLMAFAGMGLAIGGGGALASGEPAATARRMGEPIPLATDTTCRVQAMGEKNSRALEDRVTPGAVALDVEFRFGDAADPLAVMPHAAFGLRVGEQRIPADVAVTHVQDAPNLAPSVFRVGPGSHVLMSRNTVLGLLFRLPAGVTGAGAMLELTTSAIEVIGEGGSTRPVAGGPGPILVPVSP